MADYTKVIPPGQEGTIKTTIDGKKLFAGSMEKSFTVKTNDPKNETFNLSVKLTVKKVFEFSKELNWTGFVDEDVKLETFITNLMPTPINITGYKWAQVSKDKQLDTRLSVKLETVEKGKKYKLTIKKRRDIPPDRYYGELNLTTDYPKLMEKVVKFSVTVVSDVAIYPERLFFGEMVLNPGTSKSFDRVFNIIAARGDSLKILKVVPNREDMTVKIQEKTPGKAFTGTVMIRPPEKIGQYAGSLRIYTNYPRHKEMVLDVIGSVRVEEPTQSGTQGNR